MEETGRWKVLSRDGAVELGYVTVYGDARVRRARVEWERLDGCTGFDENEALGRVWRYLWACGFREIEPPGR